MLFYLNRIFKILINTTNYSLFYVNYNTKVNLLTFE